MPVLNFSPAFMASGLVCPPDKKRIEYCYADVPGLLIECRSAAAAVPTWYLRYKANGKTAYTRLGNVQELTLAQAIAVRAGFAWDRVGTIVRDQKRISAGLGYVSKWVGVDVGYAHDVTRAENWVIESSIRVFLP